MDNTGASAGLARHAGAGREAGSARLPRKVALLLTIEPISEASARRTISPRHIAAISPRDVAAFDAGALTEATVVVGQAIGGDHARSAVALFADHRLAGIRVSIGIDPSVAGRAIGAVEAATLLLLDPLLALDLTICLTIDLARLTLDLLLLLLRIGTATGTLHPHLTRRFLLLLRRRRRLLLSLLLGRGFVSPAAGFAHELRACLRLARAAIVTGALTAAASIAAVLALGARLVIVAGLGRRHRRDCC